MFNNYVSEVKAAIGECEIRTVIKNGVEYTGLIVGSGTVRPTVYLNEFYDRGVTVPEAVEKIKAMTSSTPTFDLSKVMNWDDAKCDLIAYLMNIKNVTDDMEYIDAFEYGFNDLVIVPAIKFVMSDGSGSGSAKVNAEMLEHWNVSINEVVEVALENMKTDYKIQNIGDIVGFGGVGFESPLWVVSTHDTNKGAIAIIAAKEALKEKFKNGYVAIPSSIHEMIIVSLEHNMSENDFRSIIGDVNNSVLDPVDYLGDHAYIFK